MARRRSTTEQQAKASARNEAQAARRQALCSTREVAPRAKTRNASFRWRRHLRRVGEVHRASDLSPRQQQRRHRRWSSELRARGRHLDPSRLRSPLQGFRCPETWHLAGLMSGVVCGPTSVRRQFTRCARPRSPVACRTLSDLEAGPPTVARPSLIGPPVDRAPVRRLLPSGLLTRRGPRAAGARTGVPRIALDVYAEGVETPVTTIRSTRPAAHSIKGKGEQSATEVDPSRRRRVGASCQCQRRGRFAPRTGRSGNRARRLPCHAQRGVGLPDRAARTRGQAPRGRRLRLASSPRTE